MRTAWINCLLAMVVLPALASGAEPPTQVTPEAAKFFESKIRPILVARCFECHGPESEAEGGLRVDSRTALLTGGTFGPAIKPGDVQGSLLIGAVNHGDVVQMPPKSRLPAAEIADLTAWVASGAPWPDSPATEVTAGSASKAFQISEADRAFWAFQPPRAAAPPTVQDGAWCQSAVDRFVLAPLEARGLKPAPAADKRTLIRRATFDLHGLPPTVAEVEAFLADDSPQAFATVIDRLLASPRYGERWGRHWLDIARYADSNGMDENMAMANAWRYRDYVVQSFNNDTPYDQFLCEQLAGDLLPPADDDTNHRRLTATGFLVLGPKMLAEDDPIKMEMDIIDEQVDTVGRAFLGLTLGCARCHDHKFDPIAASDYYALAGIFKSTKTMENFRVVAMWSERPLADDAKVAQLKSHDDEAARLTAEMKAKKDAGESETALAAIKQRIDELNKARPDVPHTLAVADRQPQDLRVHIRGNHLTQGELAPRGFPRVIEAVDRPAIAADKSGRLELARWLTRADHPLTSRVMVNRIWQGHFGEGLVRSPDNFGKLGESPDNQPLLDWLARQFVDSGWSIKAMHRLVMLSSAYQMSTRFDAASSAADPENRLQWRMNRRRLEAEAIRDALLAVSGQIDLAMGGSLLTNKNHTYVTSTASVNDVKYENQRRSIYLPVVRSAVYDVFSAFDFADPSTMNGRRPTTIVAPQALFMMNSALVQRQTRSMAERLLATGNTEDARRARDAYLQAYSRPPSEAESTRSLEFVKLYQTDLVGQGVEAGEARVRAWQALCRVIVSANEFIYLD